MAGVPPSIRQEIQQSKPFRSPAEEAYIGLIRTTDLVRRKLCDRLESEGVTHQQYNVLRILAGAHPESLPTLEVGERMVERAPGITRLLDRLGEKGLVERRRCPSDRRQMDCRITANGLALLDRLRDPVLEEIESAFRCIGPARVELLSRLLDDLRAGARPDVHD
ncbi:MAG: MarR family transcriptional regulator [Acidobacteria bacterium]|nr:MarR family transcriptional regulator [Acidobacteriota bacterium]